MVEWLDRGLSSPLADWIVVLLVSGAEALRSRGDVSSLRPLLLS